MELWAVIKIVKFGEGEIGDERDDEGNTAPSATPHVNPIATPILQTPQLTTNTN